MQKNKEKKESSALFYYPDQRAIVAPKITLHRSQNTCALAVSIPRSSPHTRQVSFDDPLCLG